MIILTSIVYLSKIKSNSQCTNLQCSGIKPLGVRTYNQNTIGALVFTLIDYRTFEGSPIGMNTALKNALRSSQDLLHGINAKMGSLANLVILLLKGFFILVNSNLYPAK